MTRLLPETLRGRLLLLMLLTLAVAQGLSAWLFADERELAVQAALGQEAAGRAANVASLIAETPAGSWAAIVQAANSPLVRFSVDRAPTVTHPDHDMGGRLAALIASQIRQDPPPEVRVELHEATGPMPPMAGMPPDMARMHMTMRNVPVTSVEMAISIATTGGEWLNVVTRFHHPPYQIGWTGLATFGVSALLIAVTLWVALGRLTGPLRDLAHAADHFGRGEDVEQVEATGPVELRRLTGAFNEMQLRIRRFVDDRTRLLAALSHDLRSPLTALRVRAELVEDDETRERIIGTTEEMQEMVETTLAFARGVSASETVETVDLPVFLSELVADVRTALPSVDLDPAAEALHVRVRPTAMRRALRNLIENAIRYGQRAQIAVSRTGASATISIDDAGPGIPDADLERVFEPFVRLEASRSRDTGGSGLGLAIARTIIQSHGGTVTLANRAEGGLRATVSLPVA